MSATHWIPVNFKENDGRIVSYNSKMRYVIEYNASFFIALSEGLNKIGFCTHPAFLKIMAGFDLDHDTLFQIENQDHLTCLVKLIEKFNCCISFFQSFFANRCVLMNSIPILSVGHGKYSINIIKMVNDHFEFVSFGMSIEKNDQLKMKEKELTNANESLKIMKLSLEQNEMQLMSQVHMSEMLQKYYIILEGKMKEERQVLRKKILTLIIANAGMQVAFIKETENKQRNEKLLVEKQNENNDLIEKLSMMVEQVSTLQTNFVNEMEKNVRIKSLHTQEKNKYIALQKDTKISFESKLAHESQMTAIITQKYNEKEMELMKCDNTITDLRKEIDRLQKKNIIIGEQANERISEIIHLANGRMEKQAKQLAEKHAKEILDLKECHSKMIRNIGNCHLIEIEDLQSAIVYEQTQKNKYKEQLCIYITKYEQCMANDRFEDDNRILRDESDKSDGEHKSYANFMTPNNREYDHALMNFEKDLFESSD